MSNDNSLSDHEWELLSKAGSPFSPSPVEELLEESQWIRYIAKSPDLKMQFLISGEQGFLGFSKEEIAQIEDFRKTQLYSEDRRRVADALTRSHETGGNFVIQYRLWDKPRHRLHRFQDHGRVTRLGAAESVSISGILVDITVPRSEEIRAEMPDAEDLHRPGDLPGLVFRFRNDDAYTAEYLGQGARLVTGYTADALLLGISVSFRELIHRDDLARIREQRENSTLEHSGYQVKYRLIDASGSQREVMEYGHAIFATDKARAIGFEGFIMDISEQSRTRLALRESESQLQTISNAAHDAIITLDAQGCIGFWNASAERIFGYTRSEAMGREVHRLLAPPSLRVEADRGLDRFNATGEGPVIGKAVRMLARHKSGREFPIELSVSRTRLNNSWQAVAVVRDITEQMERVNALEESEDRFRSLFDNAADGLLITDPKTGGFVGCNPRLCELLGYKEDEVKQLSVDDIHAMEDLAWIRAEFEKMTAKKYGEVVDIPLKRKDGTIFYADVSAFWITLAGNAFLVGALRDVTDRKRAEQALIREKEKLTNYLDNAAVMTIVLDDQGTVLLINRKGCELLGQPAAEILGKNWFAGYLPERIREEVTRVHSLVISGEAEPTAYFENPIVTARGKERLIAWHNSALRNSDGKIIGTLSSGEDITDRREMEAELESARQRLQFVVTKVPAIIFVCDSQEPYKITYISENIAQLLGSGSREFSERSLFWSSLVHSDDLQTITDAVSELYERSAFQCELRIRTADGRYRWYQTNLKLVRNTQGTPLEIVGYLMDIDWRKQAEFALRARERGLAHAQHIAHIGSWERRLDTDRERWSDEIFRILGYAPQAFEPSEKLLLDHIPEDDRGFVRSRLSKGIDREESFDLEFRLLRVDGGECFVRSRNEVIRDDHGHPIKLLGTVQDITDTKRAESALKRSREELRRLANHLQTAREHERTAIAREIHDELAQALAAIKIDMVRLRSKIPGDNQKVNALSSTMLKSIDGTISSVQRLLTELRPSLLDDLGLVAAIEWQLGQFQKRTGIDCRTSLPDSEPELTDESRTALFRILQEALSNVARHSNASEISVSMLIESPWLSLQIRDNGIGISDLEVIGSKSFGLIGMRERAHIFGGFVDVEGKDGAGTQVSAKIPLSIGVQEEMNRA